MTRTELHRQDRFTVLFQRRAVAAPDAPAVLDEHGLLTYQGLLDAASAHAGQLCELGVRPGDPVALELPTSRGYLVALVGVWLAGAVAVPVSTTAPADRRRHQIETAGCQATVSGSGPALSVRTVAGVPGTVLGRPPVPAGDQAAYILFTSGSSGRPKGVQVGHRSLACFLLAMTEILSCGRGDRVLALAPPHFDASLPELLLALVCGAAVTIAPAGARVNPELFVGWVRANPVTIVQATPTWWRLVLPFLGDAVRDAVLLSCGEALSADLAGALRERGRTLWNLYGPTEATVHALAWEVRGPLRDPLPIGRPLPGMAARILGPDGRTVPAGQTGELLLSGSGLAHGYLGDPVHTAAAFPTDPVTGCAYVTGDLCRAASDGTVSYLGRADNQVKVRGHRVELEEVEAVAQRCPAVSGAIALLRGQDGGNATLDLVITAVPGVVLTRRELRSVLAERLPEYMLPARVFRVDEFPLTESGKVDRRAVQSALRAGPERFVRLSR